MSKVKHLLRKLHIGDHQHQGRPPPLDPSPQATTSLPSTSSSPSSDLPQAVLSSENERSGKSNFSFFEEEFQMQLALAISVSDQGQNCVDPETAQINAAKQISLGHAPSQNLAEFLSLRYWSCNVVNYDEKVTDGFYDVFGLDSSLVVQAKLPSLAELESISPLDDNGCEVVLVNRAIDVELRKLEEQVHYISMECHALDKTLNKSFIVQKIADLVVQNMGGPVSDVEEMFRRWRARTHELRVYLNTFILPLGSLDIGHSRQRALLFKVLADRINLTCKLVKGSYYTGTDEGAVNLIKLDDGSEYIIDLMGAPGTLIPSEVPTGHYQNFGLDARAIVTVAGTPNMGGTPKTSTLNLESFASSGRVGKIQPKQMGHGFADLNPSQWGSSEESIHATWKQSTIQGFQNEENCASAVKNLFPNISSHEVGEEDKVLQRNVLLRREEDADWCQGGVHRPLLPSSGLLPEDQIAHARDTSDESDADKVHNLQIDSALNGVAEILWEDLQIGERIGIGSYGEVYRAEWNGTEVAVKKFMNQDISGDALAQFKCEVEIMLRLRHPNVVLFMGAVARPPNMSILTEYLPRGSLYKLLHRPNIQLDEKRRIKMALDVAKGMNYLHTSHPTIVHRDLKTPNLLVDKNWVVKVCDFGMSRLQHHTFLSSKSTAGTAEWMAPEVLRNEPSNEKSDVFSFGVILWELATLEVPWTGMNSMQVVGAVGFQGRHLEIPSSVDPLVEEIISDCWNRNPQARPSFAQIIFRLKRLQRLSVQKSEIRINHQ